MFASIKRYWRYKKARNLPSSLKIINQCEDFYFKGQKIINFTSKAFDEKLCEKCNGRKTYFDDQTQIIEAVKELKNS